MMPNVLLDSNVVVDFVLMRVGFVKNAEKIFEMIKAETIVGCISSSAVTDVHYIVESKTNPEYAWKMADYIERTLRIIPVVQKTVRGALDSGMADFEDAVQATAAKDYVIDTVITRDKKGFRESGLQVYSPQEFLENLEKN